MVVHVHPTTIDIYMVPLVGVIHVDTIPAYVHLDARVIMHVDAIVQVHVDVIPSIVRRAFAREVSPTLCGVSPLVILGGLLVTIGRSLGIGGRPGGSRIGILRCIVLCLGVSLQQVVQAHVIQVSQSDEVVRIGRGLGPLPLRDGLATDSQLVRERLL